MKRHPLGSSQLQVIEAMTSFDLYLKGGRRIDNLLSAEHNAEARIEFLSPSSLGHHHYKWSGLSLPSSDDLQPEMW